MRIDLVIGTLNVGGAEKQLSGLAGALHGLGVNVRVVTLFGAGPLRASLDEAGIEVVTCSSPDTERIRGRDLPVVAGRLARLWSRDRPDAVQVWLPREQSIALPIARVMGIPVRVMAVRSLTSSVQLSRPRMAAIALAARSSTCVITNSEAALRDSHWPVGDLPAFVVGNAIEVPPTQATPATTPPRGVVVANFHRYKGHLDLIQALAAIEPPVQVDLIGTGPCEADIRAGISGLGLESTVTIVGGVTDAMPFLMRSQMAILPSHTEGLPNVVLEAMAAGLPVVAYDVGGVAELVEDGESGILVSPRDVSGLARAIEWAATHPDWRKSAGARGREIASTMSWQRFAERNLEIMEAALRADR